MDTEKKNILWVDDDVNRLALLPDRDELESRGFTIIPVERVDDFLKIIKDAVHKIDCIIIDMSMATGSIDLKRAKNGTRTGLVLIEELKNSYYKNVRVVVYSVINSDDIRADSQAFLEYEIPCLDKSITPKEFANEIEKIINS